MKSKAWIVAAAIGGLTSPILFEPLAAGQAVTTIVQRADPNDLARINSQGRLRKTQDEETNEQAVVKFFGDGIHGIYTDMHTGALSNGKTPTHRRQASCTPVSLVQNTDGSL